MRIEYHPETVKDLNDAVSYYDEQLSGLVDEFREEIYETIDRIASDPITCRPFENESGFRRLCATVQPTPDRRLAELEIAD